MLTVSLSRSLRSAVGGVESIEVQASTIRELLTKTRDTIASALPPELR